MRETTNLYFIQSESGGPIKIGHATDVKARLSQHNTAHWQNLRVILIIHGCPRSLEENTHYYFAKSRIRWDREWFKEDVLDDLQKFISFVEREFHSAQPGTKDIQKRIQYFGSAEAAYENQFGIKPYNKDLIQQDINRNKMAAAIRLREHISKSAFASAQKAWGKVSIE